MPTPAEKRRAAHLKRTYSLTIEQYLAILDLQGGVCGVCGKKPPGNRNLSIDHDHVSKRVRGLLCNYCNLRIVGKHRDGELLRSAADYLESPPADEVMPPEHKTPAKKKRPRKRKRDGGSGVKNE